LLSKPNKLSFRYENKTYHIESVEEDGECAVRFEDTWYRTRDDFFKKAVIKNELLTSIYSELYLFEVE